MYKMTFKTRVIYTIGITLDGIDHRVTPTPLKTWPWKVTSLLRMVTTYKETLYYYIDFFLVILRVQEVDVNLYKEWKFPVPE